MHFFNPPALMKLVEVVAGERTGERGARDRRPRSPSGWAARRSAAPTRPASSSTAATARSRSSRCGSSTQGIAAHAQIDRIMREDGGYRMGPFELMDLIGIDVNLEVARSFYRQRPEPRWQPHPIQERMVAEGRLGRKAGRGFYDYARRRARPSPSRARRSTPSCAARCSSGSSPSSSTRPASPPARASRRRTTSTPRCGSASTTRGARSSGRDELGAERGPSDPRRASARELGDERYARRSPAARLGRRRRSTGPPA